MQKQQISEHDQKMEGMKLKLYEVLHMKNECLEREKNLTEQLVLLKECQQSQRGEIKNLEQKLQEAEFSLS